MRPERRRGLLAALTALLLAACGGGSDGSADDPFAGLPPLGEGEYYHADLIGLPAVSTEGEALGTCIAVDNFGAGDVLEIERPPENGKPGKRFMVPMSAEAVPEWGDAIVIETRFVEP